MDLLMIHAAATLAMGGLIWFVQLVHYPLFGLVSEQRFERFAIEHQRRTSWVVVPLMFTEATTAMALLIEPPPGLGRGLLGFGLILLVVIWLSTAFLQVPLHRLLTRGRDSSTIHRLVSTNWIRTVAWSARCGLVLWISRLAG
ncbi:MAG: hypothetical protein K8J08_03820 [Thermoanaerobaculia bacterium]|nr:hypothetical protein [Thermoanaerobaculia bacterium]